ncbi:hypothetical protein [Colwellia psychrerythraea]|uniref:DUF1579 domain-containing protein n=1 Tax=Colwellia psychrerythraea TaxID=28229 RepID=A0A099KW94_COLPS|nr:hypothetical protein [Colwellia psychrerythraea]KGJ93928.1 hypothetical protein GAB14E_2483 [Colwellia psychrerythraea]
MNSITPQSSSEDFDFFIGNWQVSHRRLKHRLVSCSQWDNFSGTSTTQKILGGAGNFDDNRLDMPQESYHAATLRTYDSGTGLWSIWWLDGRYSDQLDAPMQGQFINGIGTFYVEETFEGKTIKVRFLWTRPTPDTPRWEQAFSQDGGLTWETNWLMDFNKID